MGWTPPTGSTPGSGSSGGGVRKNRGKHIMKLAKQAGQKKETAKQARRLTQVAKEAEKDTSKVQQDYEMTKIQSYDPSPSVTFGRKRLARSDEEGQEFAIETGLLLSRSKWQAAGVSPAVKQNAAAEKEEGHKTAEASRWPVASDLFTVPSVTPMKHSKGLLPFGFQRKLTPAKLGDSTAIGKPIGLANLGNTCYLNSILQALSSLNAFVEYVEYLQTVYSSNRVTTDTLVPNDRDAVVECLTEAVHKINASSNALKMPAPFGGRPATASLLYLKNALEKHCPSVFAGTAQQDAHECFVRILEALEKETAHLEQQEEKKTCPFTFEISVIIICSGCKHKTIINETSTDIGLDIGTEASKKMNIADLLSNYFSAERIHKNCDACKGQNVLHGLRRSIKSFPKVLVLHIKRFVFQPDCIHAQFQNTRSSTPYSKSQAFVQPAERLNLSCFRKSKDEKSRVMQDISNKLVDKQYNDLQLDAVTYHQGSQLEFGHYISDVRKVQGKKSTWYRCNDTQVHEIDSASSWENDTSSRESYMLFYTVPQI
eukprot:jgi/Picsp_1/1491/NSC_04969-R1_ubiquitin specific protease